MSVLKKYWNTRYFYLTAMALLAVVCVIAMSGAPLMSAFGPSRFAWAQPSSLLILFLGLAIGCYGTIVGIGGGPLIVPVLFFFYGWESEFLVATSLMIVFLNAFSGTISYARQKRIDYKAGWKFALAAMPGAVLSGFVHHKFDIQMFDVIFAIFLVLLAAYSFMNLKNLDTSDVHRSRSIPASHRRVVMRDRFGSTFKYSSDDSMGIFMNLILGFFVGFLGIGGGVFQVPILLFLLRYPPHISTATSHFITALTCLFAVIPHIFLHNVFFGEAIWMGIGVIIGAQIGAWLSPKINSKIIIHLFIVIIMIFAVKLVF